jgi:hypothetical protein
MKNQLAMLLADYDIRNGNDTPDVHRGDSDNPGTQQMRQLIRLVKQEAAFIDDVQRRLQELELKLDMLE